MYDKNDKNLKKGRGKDVFLTGPQALGDLKV